MGEWCDQIFSRAAGWLGWTPDVIFRTPFPLIMLALDGKVDFIKMTNPWGSSAKEEKSEHETNADAARDLLKTFLQHPSAKPMPSRKRKRVVASG